jgi:hypothetical protein
MTRDFIKYYPGDQIREDEMGLWYTEEKEYTFMVLVGKPVRKKHFENLGVRGERCVKWVLEK